MTELISSILSNSEYKLEQFSPNEIDNVSKLISEEEEKGKIKHYIKCQIRNKKMVLKPEEFIRQLYIYKLMNTYNYPKEIMKVEVPIQMGSSNDKKADIIIYDKKNQESSYIIVELKNPKLSKGKEQLKSYCNATGAPIGIWTNGKQISYYHRKEPNFFEDLNNIPKYNEKLSQIIGEKWTIEELIKKDKLVLERKSLKDIILELEDEVLANAGVDVFEEVFKLIFTKLYDEMESGRDRSRYLEFRNYGDTEIELEEKIQFLFEKAQKKWEGIFSDGSKILLTSSHLSVCVSSLQDVKLFNSNLDVVDEAFEYLVNKSSKGEKGQYFTPRYVIEMCVRMLNPNKNETMIDTASGSCGFPVHTIFYVWKQILKEKGMIQSHLFTSQEKPVECIDYVNEKVFAIDFDEKTVRVARTLNLIAGDGQTNVLHLNTLDYERWENTAKNDMWRDTYGEGWKKLKKLRTSKNSDYSFEFDILMANPPFAGEIKESRIISKYDLAKDKKGKYKDEVKRDILFIERNINFLKNGGRMAIVLPQGRFDNSSDKYIREFVTEKCRVLAVVDLHANVFQPHTGTKTSVLFLQKWDKELCPNKKDYPIFFATMKEQSKQTSGDKIFEKSKDNSLLLDRHGHLIVKHDLFNHEGMTKDGIAEAFIEFAKKEKLSFAENFPFDEIKYKNLLNTLEISEKKISEILEENNFFRLDSIYYQNKNYINLNKIYNYSNGYELFDTCCSLKNKNFIPNNEEEYKYIELSNVSGSTQIFGCDNYLGKNLPSRAKRKVEKNDVIVPYLEGSLTNSTIISDETTNTVCSNGFHVFDSKKINSESLLALFRTNLILSLMKRGSSGTIMRSISKDELKKIPIPILSKNIQTEVENITKKSIEYSKKAEIMLEIASKIVEIALEKGDEEAIK